MPAREAPRKMFSFDDSLLAISYETFFLYTFRWYIVSLAHSASHNGPRCVGALFLLLRFNSIAHCFPHFATDFALSPRKLARFFRPFPIRPLKRLFVYARHRCCFIGQKSRAGRIFVVDYRGSSRVLSFFWAKGEIPERSELFATETSQ